MSWQGNKRRERRKSTLRHHPVKFLYEQFGGQVMTAFWTLLSIGTFLALTDKLTAEWIALAGILQTLVTFRAVGEDAFIHRTKIANGRSHHGPGP